MADALTPGASTREGTHASLKILARDSQFAHHRVQGCPGQAESRGRGAHNAAVLPEDADDVFPLYLIERHAVRRFHRIRPDFPQGRAQFRAPRKDYGHERRTEHGDACPQSCL